MKSDALKTCMIWQYQNVRVETSQNLITDGIKVERLEPKAMDVFVVLALANGAVQSRNDLLLNVWNFADASDESLSRCVYMIRRAFLALAGINPVQTVHRRGYRLSIVLESIAPANNTINQPGNITRDKPDSSLDSALLLASSANARMGDGGLAVAEQLLRKNLTRDAGNPDAWSLLADTLLKTAIFNSDVDRYALLEAAEIASENALAQAPDLSLPKIVNAQIQTSRGDFAGTIAQLESVLENDPGNAECLFQLGYAFGLIGHTRSAVHYLERAVAADPLQGRNQMNLAFAKLNLGEIDQAEVFALDGLNNRFPVACEPHAMAAYMRGNRNLAIERRDQASAVYTDVYRKVFDVDRHWHHMSEAFFSGNVAQRKTFRDDWERVWADAGLKSEGIISYAFLRIGEPDLFFESFGDDPMPGHNVSLMCLWDQSEESKSVRAHPAFKTFAQATGLANTWEVLGQPDRNSSKGSEQIGPQATLVL